jgi:MFS family permease
MPTVWEYLRVDVGVDNKLMLGVVIAVFTVARTLFFPVVGVWSDRVNFWHPYAFCFVSCVIGGGLYGLAGRFRSLPLMISGRALMGVSGATMTLNSAYLARTVPPSRLTHVMTLNQACMLIAIALGPALNAMLVPLDAMDSALLNARSAAGWLPALLNVLLLVLFACGFDDVGDAPPPLLASSTQAAASVGSTQAAVSADGAVSVGTEGAYEESAAECDGRGLTYREVIVGRGGWYLLVLNASNGFQLTALDTVVTPIVHAQYGWGTLQNSALFGGFALTALLVTVVSVALGRRCARCVAVDRLPSLRILIGVGTMAVGYAVASYWCTLPALPLWSILAFGCCVVGGVVLNGPSAAAVYASIICPHRKGEMTSLSQMLAGVARVLGPTVGSAALHGGGRRTLFAILGGVHVLVLAVSFAAAPGVRMRMST